MTGKRKIGPFTLGPIGLGCMSLSHAYGTPPDPAHSARLLNHALDIGCDFIDSAALYGFGANEALIGEAIGARRSEYVLASKCGMTGVDGQRVVDGRPETLKRTLDKSLARLKTDVIDLYYLHRWDKRVPIEESVGALGDMVASGKVRAIGLSEVSAATLRKAHAVHPIAAVQNEYSPWSRNVELGVLETAKAAGHRPGRLLADRARLPRRPGQVHRRSGGRRSAPLHAALPGRESRAQSRPLQTLQRSSPRMSELHAGAAFPGLAADPRRPCRADPRHHLDPPPRGESRRRRDRVGARDHRARSTPCSIPPPSPAPAIPQRRRRMWIRRSSSTQELAVSSALEREGGNLELSASGLLTAAPRPRAPPRRGGATNSLRCQLPDNMPRRGQILDDAAERFVDRHVGIAGAAGQRPGHDLADLAEQVILADRAGGERVQIFGALGADAFLVIGEEAGAGDQRIVDLDRAGAGRADRVDMGAVRDLFGKQDRLGRGAHRADDVGAGDGLRDARFGLAAEPLGKGLAPWPDRGPRS